MALITDITNFNFKQFIGSLPLGKKVIRDMIAADLIAHEASIVAAEADIVVLQAALANAKTADDIAGLRLIDTSDFADGQLVVQEDTGVLYRFNLGEATGSEDPPSTVDATDGGGVYHEAVAQDLGIHTPVTSIANLKGITAGNRTDNMICLVKANGAGMADLYRFVAGDATVESLPEIVEPTAGTGRWFAIGTGDLKTYNDALYAPIADPTSLGSVASVGGFLSGDFTADDTVEIAGQTYVAKVAAAADDQFTIGGTPDLSIAALIAKVNAFPGGPNVVAYAMGGGSGVFSVLYADAPGGNPVTGNPGAGLTFSRSITGPSTLTFNGAVTFDLQNAPWKEASKLMGHGSFEFDVDSATQAGLGFLVIGAFPNGMPDPDHFMYTITDSNGIPKVTDDVVEYSTDGYIFVEGQGGAAPVANGDVLNWIAFSG